jgi:hypothetical protein
MAEPDITPPPADPGSPPALDFTPQFTAASRTLGRSPEQLAQDRADFVRMGGSGEAFDRAIGATTAPAAIPPAATGPELNVAGRHAEIRLQNARDFIEQVRRYPLDPNADAAAQTASLAATLKANGYTDAEVATLLAIAPADQRSPDEVLLARAGLDAAPDPSAYDLTYPIEFTRELDPGQLQSFDAEAREALAAMHVPALQGASLVQGIVEASSAWRGLSEAGRAEYAARQDQTLANAFGSRETAQEAVQLAGAILARAPTPWLEALQASGALRSANVIAQLAHLGDLLNFRAEVHSGQRGFADLYRDLRA